MQNNDENKIIYDKQRKNYISWDEYFMAVSILSSYRSKDPSTQVGACIIDNKNRILSIGYNGAPIGFNDENFPWDREGDELDTKYLYVCHAELNAITNYSGNKKDFEGATIYVDLFPCNECAKLIIQSGIKKVIYLSDKYAATNSTIVSKRLFDTCGVAYTKLEFDEDKEIVLKFNKK
jgi:dCMP deaminase